MLVSRDQVHPPKVHLNRGGPRCTYPATKPTRIKLKGTKEKGGGVGKGEKSCYINRIPTIGLCMLTRLGVGAIKARHCSIAQK